MTLNENITLYPEPETVFADPTLAIYFKPLLSIRVQGNTGNHSVHLLTRDGLICKATPVYHYAEYYCFGFQYNMGLYKFMGDLQVFEGANFIPALYSFLLRDFEQNRDQYLNSKTTVKQYLESLVEENLYFLGIDKEIFTCYARSFYSYEFTKYYYQKYGVHRHISVVTEQWAKNTDPFLLDEVDAQDLIEEWLSGFEEDVEHQYNLNIDMLVGATETRRFAALSGSCVLSALIDSQRDLVYMVESSI